VLCAVPEGDEQVVDPLAKRGAARIPKSALGGGVERSDAALIVHADDGIERAVNQRLIARLTRLRLLS
jgi:hypothetical protein